MYRKKTCENCGTRLTLGCSWYRAEDCGVEMKEWASEGAKNTERIGFEKRHCGNAVMAILNVLVFNIAS